MTLTAEQLRAAATGEPVRFSANDVEFVVVRAEAFEQANGSADHDELRAMLARSFRDNGWDEPGMEAYDSYPANR